MRCPLSYWQDLTEAEKSDFEGQEDETFFRFGEFTFALSELTKIGNFGSYNFNAFHGVKITIEDDGESASIMGNL